MDKLEMRSVIKFLHFQGKSPSDIFNEMKNIYGDKSPSYFVIKYWIRKLKCGFNDIRDEARSGRPQSRITEKFISKIKNIVLEDRCITLKQLEFESGLSHGTVSRILHDHLDMSKVSARWVPRLLTEEMKAERKRCSEVLLEQFDSIPNFFDRLVTVDETWVYLYDPLMKYQSMQWKTRTEPAPKKAKMSRSAVKVMLTVFWDAEGIIMADYLPTGRTMNSEYYSGLIKSLKIELSKKRRNKLRNGPVFLLQDNAPPHRAAVTMETIENCGILNSYAIPHIHLI